MNIGIHSILHGVLICPEDFGKICIIVVGIYWILIYQVQ